MKRMPNIDLTKEEYIEIQKRKVAEGGEAIICRSFSEDTLYKLFVDFRRNLVSMSDNKYNKVVGIHQKNLESCVRPLSTISYDGKVVGYETTWDKYDVGLDMLTNLSRKETIKVLRSLKNILVYLDSKDITYGDIKEDNILFNLKTHQIKLCDIDNVRLGDYPVDLRNFSLNKYYQSRGEIDAGADAYMHNLLTIRNLYYQNPYIYDTDIIRDLRNEIYPTKFKEGAIPIFASMPDLEKFNGEYVIDYIKR